MKIFGLSLTTILIALLLIAIGFKYGSSIPVIKSL